MQKEHSTVSPISSGFNSSLPDAAKHYASLQVGLPWPYKHGRVLPLCARSAAASHMERALIHMNALHLESVEKNDFLYHIIPKCHMSTHLAYDFAADGVNPRRVTCYADEDMVGRVKRIVNRCHGKTAGTMSVERYAILVGTRWWTRLAELRGFRD